MITFQYSEDGFMKRLMILVVFLLAIANVFSQPLWAAPTTTGLDGIAAVVNDGVITRNQLADAIQLTQKQLAASHAPVPPPNVLRKKVLQNLIDTQIQLQIAKKIGIKVDDATVTGAINQIAQGNGVTIEDLEAKVQQEGFTLDQYRKEIKKQIILTQVQQKIVAPQVKISDQEVADFLSSHGKELAIAGNTDVNSYQIQAMLIPLPDSPTPEQVQVAKQVAQQALAQLRQGSTFEQVMTSQIGTQYNIQQNKLEAKKLSQLPDLYTSAVQKLSIGSFAGPLQAPNGFHIIKLVAKQDDSDSMPNMTETHVRHILIKTSELQPDSQVKKRLEELRATILGGLDFSKAAMDNSQDPGTAGKGGDLGWVGPGTLDPAFEVVMNKASTGQITQPFKSSFGWHILQVMGRKPLKDTSILRRQKAKEIIFQQKFGEQLQSWLATMRKIEYIKVLDE